METVYVDAKRVLLAETWRDCSSNHNSPVKGVEVVRQASPIKALTQNPEQTSIQRHSKKPSSWFQVSSYLSLAAPKQQPSQQQSERTLPSALSPTMTEDWLQRGNGGGSSSVAALVRRSSNHDKKRKDESQKPKDERSSPAPSSRDDDNTTTSSRRRVHSREGRGAPVNSCDANMIGPSENVTGPRSFMKHRRPTTRSYPWRRCVGTSSSHNKQHAQTTMADQDPSTTSSTPTAPTLTTTSTSSSSSSSRTTSATTASSTTTTTSSSRSTTDALENKNNENAAAAAATKWKTAVDPRSGRTYYYHMETRQSQWRKPPELASPEERQAMLEKERAQREFFAAMESNILKSISAGVYSTTATTITTTPRKEEEKEETRKDDGCKEDEKPVLFSSSTSSASSENPSATLMPTPLPKLNLIRTISTMDQAVLRELIQRVPSNRNLVMTSFEKDSTSDSMMGPSHLPSATNTTTTLPRACSISSHNRHRASLRSIREDTTNDLSDSVDNLSDNDSDGGSGSWNMSAFLSTLPQDTVATQKTRHNQQGQRGSFGDLLSSHWSFSLDEQETLALQKLAAITDQMCGVEEDLDDSISSSDSDLEGEEVLEAEEARMATITTATTATTTTAASSSVGSNIPRPTSLGSRFEIPLDSTTPSSLLLEKPVPMQTRRNTCGTLYVASTMSAPDKDATIQCVCAVYRTHILQSQEAAITEEEDKEEDKYAVFNDLETLQQSIRRGTRFNSYNKAAFRATTAVASVAPTLEEVTKFYRHVFGRARMEADCIIMTLIYLERLIKTTGGALRPRPSNWRSLLFSCLVLSSKVWDDMSMWNADFSQTCPTGIKFTLQRINELEVALLSALNYNVKVLASEYAKYYFLMRSMVIKSGLGISDDEFCTPLDVEGAKRLQQISSIYQQNTTTTAFNDKNNTLTMTQLARSKSVGAPTAAGGAGEPASSLTETPAKWKQVGLEHIVKM